MANSQFHQLREQVKHLTAELNELKHQKISPDDARLQKEQLNNARQQQAQAKQVLINPASTAEELENAVPFLPTTGLKEQARLDARAKRLVAEMKPPQKLIHRDDLINSAKASHSRGEYQAWRNTMKQAGDKTFADGKRLPNGKTTPSANAMRASQQLARNQYEAQQRKMEEARLRPLGSTNKKTPTMPTPLANWFN